MQREHYDEFLSARYSLEESVKNESDISEGFLIDRKNPDHKVPIRGGIPRFRQDDAYTQNFGLQWNIFRSTQLDSVMGLPMTANRFYQNTKWTKEELSGKTILEVGSGAGRFTEILLAAGARVVSFDYSIAVEANDRNNRGKGELFLFQGDLYDLPLEDGIFDYVFCYGVLQHCPHPNQAYKSIFSKLKPGGKISIDHYVKFAAPSPWREPDPWYTPKHFWRPITTRMNPRLLLAILRLYIPLYLPFDTILRTRKRYGSKILGMLRIPCFNYVGTELSKKQRQEWAILDTFDALSAKYDFPKSLAEVEEMVASPHNRTTEVFYGSNGIVANVEMN